MVQDLMLRAGKAAAWVAVSKWLDLIGAVATLAITARLLSPDVFGVFGMACLAVLLPEIVLSGSLAEAVIQRKDLRPGHLNGIFWMHMGLFALFMSGLWLAIPLVAAHFNRPELSMLVTVMAMSSLFWALSTVPGALLRRDLKFGAICIADTLSTGAALVSGVVLALMGFGVWTLVWSEVARRMTKSSALWIAAGWTPGFAFSRADISDLLRFNVLTLATQFIMQFETAVPRYFVGTFLGAHALGYFNMAVRFYQQLTQVLIAPFASVALPVVAAVQHDRERLHGAFESGSKAATMLAYPTFIGAAALAPVAVPYIFGEQWTPAVPAAQLLTLAALRTPLYVFNGEILRGTGKPGLYTALAGLGSLSLLVLTPLAVGHGIVMVSMTMLACSLLHWFLGAFLVQRTLGYPLMRQFTVGWQSLVAAAGMGLGVTSLIPEFDGLPRLVSLSALILIGMSVHIALLALLAPSLARRLLALGLALVRLDRKAMSAALGIVS